MKVEKLALPNKEIEVEEDAGTRAACIAVEEARSQSTAVYIDGKSTADVTHRMTMHHRTTTPSVEQILLPEMNSTRTALATRRSIKLKLKLVVSGLSRLDPSLKNRSHFMLSAMRMITTQPSAMDCKICIKLPRFAPGRLPILTGQYAAGRLYPS